MKSIIKKSTVILIILVMALVSAAPVFGVTYKFDPSGEEKNPFCPRGYMIEVGDGTAKWLNSPFDNSGELPVYTGSYTGLDYVDADEAGTLYALTDRNPIPGKQYLSGYKNGSAISDFSSYIGEPSRADIVTTGKSTGWKIPINIKLEKGCIYEFAFLRGMKANNGITLVFSEDGKGYIQNPSTTAERNKYNKDKYDEFEFIVSYEKNVDAETGEENYYNFYMVPMRFTVQTYADMTKWEKAYDKAQVFVNSITETDLKQGKYKRSNVVALKELLKTLNEKAETIVKKQLQPQANVMINDMIDQLNDMLDRTKNDKPEPSDISKLLEKLKEAEALYAKASANTGIDIGQYGEYEVKMLGIEIDTAKGLDKFSLQDEIDAETDALEAAMMEVRKSLKMEEMLYFYDKATGIYVIAPMGSVPSDAKLYVRRMGQTSKEYKAMKDQLGEKETQAIYYKIQFYHNEYKIQPKEKVEVQIPIDSSISQKSSVVYSVEKNGSLKKMPSVMAEGTQILKTDELSALVVAGSAATEEEKAAARSQKMKSIISQTEDEKKDNKETELAKEKKKKEEFKDPLNKLLKRNANTATFSNDVRKETNPTILIFAAGLLAAIAVFAAFKGIMDMRRNKR